MKRKLVVDWSRKGDILVGQCNDPDLLFPIIEGHPMNDNITRFDVICPAKWKYNRIFFNGVDMGPLGFRVGPGKKEYLDVAPKHSGGWFRIGRVQCASDAEWLTSVLEKSGVTHVYNAPTAPKVEADDDIDTDTAVVSAAVERGAES